MNYQEMTDFEINMGVAVSLKDSGVISKILTPVSGIPEYSAVQCIHTKYGWMWFDPCESWADAGPIIQDNFIDLESIYRFTDESEDKIEPTGSWCARGIVSGQVNPRCEDANPLRAAMIVFLMMKGGE